MKRILPAIAALALAPVAYAGVPSVHQAENAKWMKVNENWTVDTEDVGRRADRIRFWVRRRAKGNEEMSTQQRSTWTGKIEIRCGDFHYRGASRTSNGWGGYAYVYGPWEKIDESLFPYTLASNFCHLTGAPGFTPEPIEHDWQRKLTAAIKAEPKKEARSTSNDDLCSNGTRHPRCDHR